MRGMAREYAAGNSRGPTDVPPAKAAQEGPEGGWRLDCATENTGRPTGTQRIGVVDAVAASQRSGDQRQHLVPPVGPPWRRRGQVDGRRVPAGPGAGRGWPALATRRWSSKAMRIRSGLFCGSICWVLLVSGRVSVPKPLSQIQREPPPVSSRAVPKAVLRWIQAKAIGGDGGQLKTKAPAGSPRA